MLQLADEDSHIYKLFVYFLTAAVLFVAMIPSGLKAQDVIIEPITEAVEVPAEEAVSEPEVQSYQKQFVCSAYYSPLPGQSRYATGSYAGDIRLNGSGVNGASGRPVFSGMVAAPSIYPFGTKMFIDGIGMTEVADRGGAIKGNRLDIWFGHGDEALLRALQYGKRNCLVTVYGLAPSVQTNVTLPTVKVTGYSASPVSEKPFTFKVALEEGDEGEAVARLQQFLKDLDYYNETVTGKYEASTTEAVRDFQNQYGILKDASLATSGQFSGTTIDVFKNVVLGQRRDEYFVNLKKNLGKGDTGASVTDLQKALLRLGYKVVITGVYDEMTVEAVLTFQIDRQVLSSKNDLGAGYFGPKTYNALNKELIVLDNKLIDESKEVVSNTTVDDGSIAITDFEGLELGMEGKRVYLLQEELAALNYFGVDPTGYYGPLTEHAVFKLQQKLGHVKRKTDKKAGKVTPELAQFFEEIRAKRFNYVSQGIEQKSNEKNVLTLSGKELKYGDVSEEVKLLQAFLQKEGFFSGKITTTYFGKATKRALVAYQLDRDLIVTESDLGAGVLNPETHELILREMYAL